MTTKLSLSEAVLIIKGTIADLPEPQRSEVYGHYQTLRQMLTDHPLVGLAIALLGAKLAK